MASHITTHDPIVSREGGHPVIPELRAAADAVLEPHRLLFGYPGIGIVIDLIMHLTIVGSDCRHVSLLALRLRGLSTTRYTKRQILGGFCQHRRRMSGMPDYTTCTSSVTKEM